MSTSDEYAVSDDDLMLRLQSGDNAAFTGLVERYQGRLIGFFVRMTGDPHLAEDLAQETLLKLYQNAWDYLPSGKFQPWLFQIGRNLSIDAIRRGTRDALVHAVKPSATDDGGWERLAAEIASPVDQLSQRELSRSIDESLPALPEDQRMALVLFHFFDMSLPDIATAMDCNLSTCKSRLRLARERLHKLLDAHRPVTADQDSTEGYLR